MDVVKEVRELKNQLAYAKNLAFFFGAGTSCALTIPNIETLTTGIEKKLKDDHLKHFVIIKDSLKKAATASGKTVNIEDILNQINPVSVEELEKVYKCMGRKTYYRERVQLGRLHHPRSSSRASCRGTQSRFVRLNGIE